MAEENGAADPQAQPAQPPKMQVLGQYIRDLSFENIAMQKQIQATGQPEIQVKVGLDARKRADTQYEVLVKLNVESKTKDETPQTIFVMELDYAGVFTVENVPEAQLHPFLMIECPRMLFPFIRRVVHDVTRDGGFPPLNLENIDFLSIYRNEIQRRQAAQTTADA
ncbi:protein-export chaperone SecB [Rhodobacterales bacterium HKCCE2091]|nr:protein-export chaperone SecB [Rhodobacterales bacterium HKCCE2091]